MAKQWSKEWLKYVDYDQVTPFPLQLANCDRLEENNAVYIFDEVGSGKTISAGFMALHYLYHNYYEKQASKTKILVITTTQLADKDDGPGPFKQLWLNKLPFQDKRLFPLWQLSHQIEVINYDYRNIQGKNKREQGWTRSGYKTDKNNWDLVIIDEAHMFLNPDTARYKELTGEGDAAGKISAKKVVFLTATPIKRDLSDLQVYSEIARWITPSGGCNINHPCYTCFNGDASRGANTVLAPGVRSGQIAPENLICATFDTSLPFTRYFKDTVRELSPCDSDELPPRRKLAKTWMCNRENRQEVVLKKINALYGEAPESNRFVLFVRWVKKNGIDPGCSAEELEAYFIEHGFAKWEDGCREKSVEVVTGANHKSLSAYRDPDPSGLPTVLIINYQIGEQGVNLPGYNHVINYHIPASPASLEQRFGRIDRLDSASREINAYFPLLESHCDNSTINFYIAVSTYLKQQLPVLPARNSILTEEILDVYEKHSMDMREQAEKIKRIRELWKSDKQRENARWIKILKYVEAMNNQGGAARDGLDPNEYEVAEFILGAEKTKNINNPEAERIQRVMKICNDRLEEILAATASHDRIETTRELIRPNGDEIGNRIFYYVYQFAVGTSQEMILKNLKTISPVGAEGCAGIIRNLSSYIEYENKLKPFLRQP